MVEHSCPLLPFFADVEACWESLPDLHSRLSGVASQGFCSRCGIASSALLLDRLIGIWICFILFILNLARLDIQVCSLDPALRGSA